MIKRILLCLIAAMMLLLTPALADEQENLIKNPGFEMLDTNGLPMYWDTDAYILREGVTLYRASDDAHSGVHSAVVENCDMNDARFAQVVEVKPNTMYRLSGWIKATAILDAGYGANLSIEGVHARSSGLYETDDEWVYVETYGITDDDQTEATIFARVGGYSGESQGMAAFDDLSLVVVEDLPVGVYAQAWYVEETVQVINPVDSASTGETESQPFWPWLIVISCVYCGAAAWLMRHLQLDRHAASNMEAASSPRKSAFSMPLFAVVGLCVAAAARLCIAFMVEGYQVDVNCFTAWGNTMSSVGPALFYQSNWCDYTPGYIYVMGLNGLLARLLSPLVSAAFVHKLIPMGCDLIGAWLIYRLAVEHDYSRKQGGLLAILLAFNPAIILNSAAWCQIDSVLCVGLMLVAYFAIHRKWAIVLPMYVLCILVKPQALMLGFLGLAAIIQEWMKNSYNTGISFDSKQNKGLSYPLELLLGLGISLLLALVIILPFCPNQESPLWLIELYGDTLASYPYATVNTANLYYLAGANWDGIANPASTGVCAFFAVCSLGWCIYTFLRQRNNVKLWWLEPAVMAVYASIYTVLLFNGCTWTILGVVSMSMAFALVLPMYVRSGKLENLPVCGAVIFILLYVFGIKMHERYLFPAFFLLGMAYAIRRDRRILWLLIVVTFTLFINEGIVLDNSLRLGSSMGHLNADTTTLANILSVMNVFAAIFSLWSCHSICVMDSPVHLGEKLNVYSSTVQHHDTPPCSPLNFKGNSKLGLHRLDVLLMLAVTAVYSMVTLTTLGSTKAPQTPWKSSANNEYVYIDLGQHYDDFSMLYFCQVSYQNFAVAVSDDADREGWSEEYPAEMREGLCFSWQYLDPSYMSGGSPSFVNASDFSSVQKLSGRFVRINPKQVGLIINEVIFKDAQGNIIPDVTIMGRVNGNAASSLYSSPEHLLDEQNSLDGEPSWWNSTYFDEIYHARTAFEHFNGTTAYEWTHPPLGKILMSWFIGIFGMTPFGWRFAGALCGILMLPAMYLLVKQLTKRTDMAFVAMSLMTLDCMHFTQTRLATIDSYPVLFIMLSYFFMLRFMQHDIVLEDIKKLLSDLALCGFFMGCSVASKWIGVYAGLGLAVLYFWTCFRHLRMSRMAGSMQSDGNAYSADECRLLEKRSKLTFMRIFVLCMWCLLFFVAVPIVIYLLSYSVHYSYLSFDSFTDFLKTVINCQESMLSYHGKPGLGMDHAFYSPWYEWPLMMTPMYYASASFKPEGMTYAIFCFGNPWVWLVGLAGIAFTVYCWLKEHRYTLAAHDGTLRLYRRDWDVAPGFILIGLLAQFLPWVLVPRGTYIYHYFASVPFLILGTTMLLHHLTRTWPKVGRIVVIAYLALCLLWFVILFPYASGLMTSESWMAFIRDYPYISNIEGYWQSNFLLKLNQFLEAIPIFPHVYYH